MNLAASKDAEIVELLLKFGSNKNIKNKRGQLAIDIAKESNNLEALFSIPGKTGDKNKTVSFLLSLVNLS